MQVAVAKETFPGERRVALTPAVVPLLQKAGLTVLVERGAGLAAGYADQEYADKGVQLVARDEAFAADILCQVRTYGANPDAGRADLALLRPQQTVLGASDPLGAAERCRELTDRGVTLFALELIPRITRAQSMDILSSMATVAGYRAVLLAAEALPRMFPMMMTAAGTISAAKVFILGAGVAGLQAIATARRLGGVVQAYDTRPVVREQVESLGAKFVELDLQTTDAEGAGGYAKAQDDAFYEKQRALLADVAAECDVVITTAAIPGQRSPLLITEDAVRRMRPGSVIVDLAAERGGNCELSRPDERVVAHNVTILGPTNLASEAPYHASQMFAKNVATFLQHLVKDGELRLDLNDEITHDTLVGHGGHVTHPRLRSLLQMEPLPREEANPEPTGGSSSESVGDEK